MVPRRPDFRMSGEHPWKACVLCAYSPAIMSLLASSKACVDRRIPWKKPAGAS